MKITTHDKREGGCRHGEENGGEAGKLICLGDGVSQQREEKWVTEWGKGEDEVKINVME